MNTLCVIKSILDCIIDSLFEECAVCYEDILKTNKLSCGHVIHLDCIYKSKKDTCPLCRRPLLLTKEQRSHIKIEDEDEVEGYEYFFELNNSFRSYHRVMVDIVFANAELLRARELLGRG